MKFSLIFEGQMNDSSPSNEQKVLRDCVDQAVFAEEMGFDAMREYTQVKSIWVNVDAQLSPHYPRT